MIGQTQIGHLSSGLCIGSGTGSCAGYFNLGVVKFFLPIIGMIIWSFEMFSANMSFNGSNAFDGSDSTTWIGALIYNFLKNSSKKIGN